MKVKTAAALAAHLVLVVLAMQAAVHARPGTRHGRQDLRMLPANSTGTPQDQALAGGVVEEPAEPTPGPTAAPAATQSPLTTASLASSTALTTALPSATSAPLSTPVPVMRAPEPKRRTPSSGQPASAHAETTTPSAGASPGPAPTPMLVQDRSGHPQHVSEDTNIVFPSPPPRKPGPSVKFDPFARHPTRAPPACAKGSTFCTEIENYPENYLQTMLRSNAVNLGYKEYFGNDVIPEGSVAERIDVNDENPLCPYEETVVYPKVAKNKEDKWLYVVNQEQFVQGVRIETCLNAGTSCQFAESFPLGYTTSCRQKYILRKLVALNPEGQTQTDMFRLPSCCSCYVTRSSITSRKMTPAVKKAGSKKR